MRVNSSTYDSPDAMDMVDYQRRIRSFYIFNKDAHQQYALLGLVAEVGEFAGHLAKYLRDVTDDEGGEQFANILVPKLRAEAGDILFLLTCLADGFDWDLGDLARENIEKLEGRKARGTISGSGDTR